MREEEEEEEGLGKNKFQDNSEYRPQIRTN